MNQRTTLCLNRLRLTVAPGLLLFFAFGLAPQARAQDNGSHGQSRVRSVVNIAALAKLREISRETQAEEEPDRETIGRPMPVPERAVGPEQDLNALRDLFNLPRFDGALSPQSLSASPSPATVFLGLDDDDTSIPPDTNGAVGPNHLMVVLNSQIRIQDRAGNPLSTVSLRGFWASLNNPKAFDPKVLYDPYSNRWMMSAAADAHLSTSALLVGVSQTGDPSGNWNLYRIAADASGQTWADYPSIGFNKDWIIETVNHYSVSDGSYKQSYAYVFSKSDLYSRGAGQYTLLKTDAQTSPAIVYDNSLSGSYLLANYNSNANGNGYLGLYSVNGPVGSETISAVTLISTPSPWTLDQGSADFLPQLGSSNKIQTDDARMKNVVYRNGSLWAVQSILLPAGSSPTHTSVQWWQLSPAGAVLQRGRIDDPNGAISYSCPSLAVNASNDVLIGYSRFAANQFVSADYSFRAGSDPAGTLRGDMAFKNGEASYFKRFTGSQNRWGDYSNTAVDPVNDLDMWTIQEYAATPASGADRWGVWWARVSTLPPSGDFSLSVPNSTQSISAGGSATFNINTLTTSGTPQTLSLALMGLPSGANAQFTPSSVTSGQSSVLVVSTSASTAPGSYSLSVNATGSSSHSTTLSLTVLPPSANPIDDPQTFVSQHYIDFLNRQADPDGLSYWSSQITRCGSDANCIKSRRVVVSAAFFIELEFQQTGSFVYRMYKGSLGREPLYNEFIADRSQVVGGSGLAASKAAFADAWVHRQQFLQKYPQGMASDQFVDALLQTVMLTDGTDLTSQRGALIAALNGGSTRAQVVQQVVESTAFVNAEYNPSFVLMQYFGYLRRDADRGGYNFWLNVLSNREPNNFHGMVCSFITSAEYQLRFGSAVTHTNADCGN
jgi:hypothetical protein